MNVDFTDEQVMLKESLSRRFAAADGLRSMGAAERWQDYAEAGLLAMAFPASCGGLDAGPVEVMIFMEEAGRAQVHDPFVSTVALAGEILRQAADQPLAASSMADIAAGSAKFSLAHWEAGSRHDHRSVNATALPCEGGWRISGHKVLVADAREATRLLVSARTGRADELSLFLVDPQAAGVQVKPMRSWDAHSVAAVTLEGVDVSPEMLIGATGGALAPLSQALEVATAAICAEAVGAMAGAFGLTMDYLKTRRQFKVPLSTFQALRHRAVDMLMALDLARNATLAAASACQAGDPDARRLATSRAKVQVNRSARFIAQNAVQLHGAIGLTDEYQLGDYFKRLTVIGQLYGDEYHHLRLLANEPGLDLDAKAPPSSISILHE